MHARASKDCPQHTVKRKLSRSLHGKAVKYVSDFVKQCRFLHTHLHHMVNRALWSLKSVKNVKLYLTDKICVRWLFHICYLLKKKKKAKWLLRPRYYYQAIKWHLATEKRLHSSVLQPKIQAFYELVPLKNIWQILL